VNEEFGNGEGASNLMKFAMLVSGMLSILGITKATEHWEQKISAKTS
jgi:hypothetical protein